MKLATPDRSPLTSTSAALAVAGTAAPAMALLLMASPSLAQQIAWHRQFGTPRSDSIRALAPAPSGGVFAVGKTTGDFSDPMASARGGGDGFVALFDEHGQRQWLTQFGTQRHDEPSAAAPDGAGGVFIAGGVDFVEPFLARYDDSGLQLWIRYLGQTASAFPLGLAPDSAGGIYIAGRTPGDVGGPNAGGLDVWIARYDADGERLWARQFGTDANDVPGALAPDGTGGVYIGGTTHGNLAAPNSGESDAFLMRLDSDGTHLWSVQFGTETADSLTELARDSAGGVFIGGRTGGTITPGGTGPLLLGRYDSAGNRQWIQQFGEVGPHNSLTALAAADGGGVFVGGNTNSAFGGPSHGTYDAWLALHAPDGSQSWLMRRGTSEPDSLATLAPDGRGGVFAGGHTFGDWSAQNLGEVDGWVARIGGICYANCDNSTVSPTLNIEDFTCFINAFAQASMLPHHQQLVHYANCDGSTAAPVLNVDDFTCFINNFSQGCP